MSGTATLTESGGLVQVDLNLLGLPQDGVPHLAHIHTGVTCVDDRDGQGGPVEFPLEDVMAQGNAGSSTSPVNTILFNLFDSSPRHVNVHAEKPGEGAPPGVACANLAMTSGGCPLPRSGGIPLLPIGVAAQISFGLMEVHLARRRAA